jgi:hypothetical protein
LGCEELEVVEAAEHGFGADAGEYGGLRWSSHECRYWIFCREELVEDGLAHVAGADEKDASMGCHCWRFAEVGMLFLLGR